MTSRFLGSMKAHRKQIGIGAAAVAFLVVVGLMIASVASGDPTPIPTLTVEKKPYLRQVTAEGNLKALKSTSISSPAGTGGGHRTPLKIAWILDDASPVKAGDVIVRFDSTDFERDLLEGREDRSRTTNQAEGAEANAGATRTNLGRDAKLADRELQSAREFQLTDAEIFSRFQVIESGIDEDLAVEKKEFAEQMQFVRDQLFQTEREILGIDERKADLRINRAQDGLSTLEVTAPHDGIIVLQRDWRGELPRIGSSVFARNPIGEIPDLSSMSVEAFVLEADAGGIAAGQEAVVIVEAHPRREFKATVDKVEPIAKPRFRGSPVQYFGVTLKLAETDPTIMKPGARVRATITLDKSDSAIAVPRQAIFDRDGKKVVYRRTAEGFEVVPIETGSASIGAIVVKSGLESGDVIALRNPDPSESEQEPAEGES